MKNACFFKAREGVWVKKNSFWENNLFLKYNSFGLVAFDRIKKY